MILACKNTRVFPIDTSGAGENPTGFLSLTASVRLEKPITSIGRLLCTVAFRERPTHSRIQIFPRLLFARFYRIKGVIVIRDAMPEADDSTLRSYKWAIHE